MITPTDSRKLEKTLYLDEDRRDMTRRSPQKTTPTCEDKNRVPLNGFDTFSQSDVYNLSQTSLLSGKLITTNHQNIFLECLHNLSQTSILLGKLIDGSTKTIFSDDPPGLRGRTSYVLRHV